MTIALAQINPIVGDLEGNVRRIVGCARRAHVEGADLVVFPELCVTGYPPQDLLENAAFLEAAQQAAARAAAEAPPAIGLVLGAPVPNPQPVGRRAYNAALLYEGGRRVAEVHKRLLPTYDIFDEHRYFEPAGAQPVVAWRGWRLGLHVCEDMWNTQQQAAHRLYDEDPVADLAGQGADLLVNISASPFAVGKHAERDRLVAAICRRHGVPFALCNTVGANAEVIFDGDSRIHAADGTQIRCAASFEEDLIFWNVDEHVRKTGDHVQTEHVQHVQTDKHVPDDRTTGTCSAPRDDVADLRAALVLGIRDYFEKTGLFTKALVGLSGGLDSAVTCALAAEALGPEHVVGVAMPSRHSSKGSVADAEALAQNLGVALHHVPIEPTVAAFDAMLAGLFAGTEAGLAEENIQARARGVTLMALSNKFGYLLLSTGNKSEMAVGYTTLYGDMSGGLAALSDVLKTDVYALAEHLNTCAGRPVIPRSTIEKAPSAELRPGQRDEDALGPYARLDRVLRCYVEEQMELGAIVEATGFDAAFVRSVLRRVDENEYKRRQAPPGLRVSGKAFGAGRRLPIVMRWERRAVSVRV